MRACERLLKYVRINTQSSPETGTTPSTPGQWELGQSRIHISQPTRRS